MHAWHSPSGLWCTLHLSCSFSLSWPMGECYRMTWPERGRHGQGPFQHGLEIGLGGLRRCRDMAGSGTQIHMCPPLYKFEYLSSALTLPSTLSAHEHSKCGCGSRWTLHVHVPNRVWQGGSVGLCDDSDSSNSDKATRLKNGLRRHWVEKNRVKTTAA